MAGIRRRLPPGWVVAERTTAQGGKTLILKGADGRSAQIAFVVRKGLVPRDVSALVASAAGRPMLVASLFLGERTKALLAQANISYADATGNLRLVLSNPGVFLESQGALQDPDRVPRTLHSLRGSAAGRVVRALCETSAPFGVRALAGRTGASLGTISCVVQSLESEMLLPRGPAKQIVSVHWAALLIGRSADYGVTTTNVLRPYLEPRGLGALWSKLCRLPRYVATGSVAGTGIAPPALAMVYVDGCEAEADASSFVPAEAGGNVWLLEP